MGRKGGNSKLVDVAKLAKCSPATVSRVMNGNEAVDEALRERVTRASRTLGYVPNGSARALRSTRSRLIGAIIPTLDHAIYATMVDSLQARLSEKDVSLIINTSSYDLDLEYKQARLLVERGVESVVLVGSVHRPATISMLEQKHISYVFTYTSDETAVGAAVGFDNEKAGAIAAKYLLDLGHTRFGMIAGLTRDNDRALGRKNGFLSELARSGINISAVPVVEGAYRLDDGKAAMKRLMSEVRRPTAVFCGSDILAAGAVRFCHSEKIGVPGQVSIMGFDNLEVAELTTPELTTLEVPAREMGRLAADYVLASLSQQQHIRHHELPIRLVIRGSTSPAAKTEKAQK